MKPLLPDPTSFNWREFEQLCLVLFANHFESVDATYYCNCGPNIGQRGIDIHLTTTKPFTPELVVIQCKASPTIAWSDFENDFERAVGFIEQATISGRDLRFILATTAGTANLKHIETEQQKLLARICAPEIAKRVHFKVYTYPDLEGLARCTPKLKELLLPPERIADKEPTHGARMLARQLIEHVTLMELAEAKRALAIHLSNCVKRDTSYGWAPSLLFDPLADVYLASGDFVQAAKLFEVALGADPLNAKYMLGHLRARRLLREAPRDNVVRGILVPSPPPPPALADEIRRMAPELLTSLGDLDHQLTLALWVVSYTNNIELAEAGLRHAFGLINLGWPEDAERLDPACMYAVTDCGYIAQQPDSGVPWYRDAGGRILSCALTTAYSYIRLVHQARFGAESMLSVEQTHGGWPKNIDGISHRNVQTFFDRLHTSCQGALRQHLPSLNAEVVGRSYAPPPSDDFIFKPAKPLERTLYVATDEFLLRDCSERLVDRRIEEIRHAGFMAQGSTIMITHHGLERLCQVRFTYELDIEPASKANQAAHAMLSGINRVLEHLVRFEVWPFQQQAGGRPPFGSAPAYFDNLSQAYNVSLEASIATARWRNAPFCVSTLSEHGHATDELCDVVERVLYWLPPQSEGASNFHRLR